MRIGGIAVEQHVTGPFVLEMPDAGEDLQLSFHSPVNYFFFIYIPLFISQECYVLRLLLFIPICFYFVSSVLRPIF